MISKNLFSNLLKEDLKRRLWTIALSVLMFFIAFPIVCALSIGGDYNTWERTQELLTQILATNNFFINFITILGALVCGLSSFYYLHSKKKVDLFHSIPIRREKLFVVNYLNGLLIYIVPYLINIIVAFLIIQINGHMTGELLKVALIAISINFMFYTIIYTLAVIAVLLTGNIVISIFGTGVFLCYGPLLMIVKEIYYSDFFKHYPGTFSEWKMFTFLSPIGSYLHMANVQIGYSYKTYSAYLQEGIGLGIVKTLITILVLVAFAIFLFKKRSSEAAGKAMSFSISKPIIKFLLIVPITMLGGIIFKQISSSTNSMGWFVFGLIFIFVIISAIIEIMFNFDIRTAFTRRRHLLLSAIVTSIVICIFQFDLFHYDSYLPSKDKIAYMSVYINNLYSSRSYFNENKSSNVRTYMTSQDYHLKYVKLKEIDAAYSLAELGMKENTDYLNTGNESFNYRVKYVLNNGKEVERIYQLESAKYNDLITSIYDSKEFREVHYQIYDIKSSDILSISADSQKGSKDITLSDGEMNELLEIYKDELSMSKLQDLVNSQVVATINFRFKNEQYASYEVYSNFTELIEFLEVRGFKEFYSITAENVNTLGINYYPPNGEAAEKYADINTITYTNKEEIEEILLNAIDQERYWRFSSVMDKNDYLDIYVTADVDDYGNGTQASYFFRKDRIPDFVKEDFGIKN